MIRQIKLASLVCVLVVAAQAQEPSLGKVASQNRADQQARRQAVLELVQEITPREVFDRMMSQMMDAASKQMELQMQREGGALPADFSSKMKRVINSVMSYDEMMQWSAEIYAKRFTLDEIGQLRSFYRTPLGQKMVRQLPDIMNDVMAKVTGTITERMPVALKREGLLPQPAAQR